MSEFSVVQLIQLAEDFIRVNLMSAITPIMIMWQKAQQLMKQTVHCLLYFSLTQRLTKCCKHHLYSPLYPHLSQPVHWKGRYQVTANLLEASFMNLANTFWITFDIPNFL